MESWFLVWLGMAFAVMSASALLIALYQISPRAIGKFKANAKESEG